MKRNKIKELSEKTIAELNHQLDTLRVDIARLTMEKNSRRLKDVALIGKKRKEIARILTFKGQKEKKS